MSNTTNTNKTELELAREFWAYSAMANEYVTYPEDFPESETHKYGSLPDRVYLIDKYPDEISSYYTTYELYRDYIYTWLMKTAGIRYDIPHAPHGELKPLSWDIIQIDPVTIEQPAKSVDDTVNEIEETVRQVTEAVQNSKQSPAIIPNLIKMATNLATEYLNRGTKSDKEIIIDANTQNSQQVPEVQAVNVPVIVPNNTQVSTPVDSPKAIETVIDTKPKEKKEKPEKKERVVPSLLEIVKGMDNITVEKVESKNPEKLKKLGEHLWKAKITINDKNASFDVFVDEYGELISASPKFVIVDSKFYPVLGVELKAASIEKWSKDYTSYRGCLSKSILDMYNKSIFKFERGAEKYWNTQKLLTQLWQINYVKDILTKYATTPLLCKFNKNDQQMEIRLGDNSDWIMRAKDIGDNKISTTYNTTFVTDASDTTDLAKIIAAKYAAAAGVPSPVGAQPAMGC